MNVVQLDIGRDLEIALTGNQEVNTAWIICYVTIRTKFRLELEQPPTKRSPKVEPVLRSLSNFRAVARWSVVVVVVIVDLRRRRRRR